VTADKKCRKMFEEWAIKALLIREGEDYEYDPAWEAWKRAWVRSMGVTIAKERKKYEEYNKPLTEEEIKELWKRCGTGKSFARMIESRHGIRK
jgi:hypothetical protein